MTARRCAGALALALTLAGCADYTVVATTPAPSQAALGSLPPIGFNHRYGNTPLAARDGFTLERRLFAQGAYWEVSVRAEPVPAGYVDLTDPGAVGRARRAVTSLELVLASENVHTIDGLLAYPTDAGQASYCEAVVGALRGLGYDSVTSLQVLVFFTEQDEHATLRWTPASGYAYTVLDHDLRGSGIGPGPLTTPLPQPTAR